MWLLGSYPPADTCRRPRLVDSGVHQPSIPPPVAPIESRCPQPRPAFRRNDSWPSQKTLLPALLFCRERNNATLRVYCRRAAYKSRSISVRGQQRKTTPSTPALSRPQRGGHQNHHVSPNEQHLDTSLRRLFGWTDRTKSERAKGGARSLRSRAFIHRAHQFCGEGVEAGAVRVRVAGICIRRCPNVTKTRCTYRYRQHECRRAPAFTRWNNQFLSPMHAPPP